MNTMLKRICLVPLLLAVAISPLVAQNDKADTNAAAAKAPVPAPPQVPEPPPAPQAHENEHGIRIESSGGGGPTLMEATIAIIAILAPFGCIIAVGGLIYESNRRRNEQLHETLRAMIEKGVAIPPELIAPPQFTEPFGIFGRRKRNDLRRGLIFLFLGVGFIVFFKAIESEVWPVGFIFIFLGFALLLFYKLDKKNETNSQATPK